MMVMMMTTTVMVMMEMVIIEWPESTDFTRRTQLGKIVTLPRILPISSSLRALL
jgi:hypothetical protein